MKSAMGNTDQVASCGASINEFGEFIHIVLPLDKPWEYESAIARVSYSYNGNTLFVLTSIGRRGLFISSYDANPLNKTISHGKPVMRQ